MSVPAVIVGVVALAACLLALSYRAERVRRAENARAFFEGVLNRIADPVFVKDRQHRLVVVNEAECRLAGRERAELVGKTDHDFFPEEQVNVFWQQDDLVFETGRESVNEEAITDAAGVLRTIVTKKTLHVDSKGEMYIVGVIRDITDRKRAEEQVRKVSSELEQRVAQRTAELARANLNLSDSDRRKSEFLAVLSHELRNPLAPIRSALWVLDRVDPAGPEAAHAKGIINRQVAHLAHIVDDLLDVTRISRGKIRLQKAHVDLVGLVSQTSEDHAALFSGKGISLHLHLPDLPIWADADPTRIAQVVGNLLSNAAKFSNPGGHVSVDVERERGAMALLRVRDDGMGLAPEILDHVFEPLTQADTSLHRTRGGLGLGLSLVKLLVELHGGSVEARSEGPGRGAEFVARLPLAQGEPAFEGTVQPSPAGMLRRRVLVIEDNLDAAEILRDALLLWGHDVEVAHDGRRGVEKARSFQPDIVLCDIGLPVMDGYEVARTIRADPALRSTYLVALTGYALPEDERRAADAGFNVHLGKPVSMEVLEDVLQTAPGAVPHPGASAAPRDASASP